MVLVKTVPEVFLEVTHKEVSTGRDHSVCIHNISLKLDVMIVIEYKIVRSQYHTREVTDGFSFEMGAFLQASIPSL